MTQDAEHEQLIKAGRRIRAAREARGLNLHELARLQEEEVPQPAVDRRGGYDLGDYT